jgi:putative ATP/GTP binding protein
MVDATKVSSIKIDTGYAGVKDYPIFTRKNSKEQILKDARCSIILGKNGSGKSTIARGLKGKNNSVEFFDKDGNQLKGDCPDIYVFDERFIYKHFLSKQDDFLQEGSSEDSSETLDAITAYRNSESFKAEKDIFKDMMRSDSRQNASVEGFAQAENNAGTKSDDQDVRGGGCSVGLSRNLEAHKSVIDLIGNMGNVEDFINALGYISMGIVLEGEEYDPNIILENINSLLYQVFGRDYISLAHGVQQGKYRALIRDEEVPLSKLSTGERNVLALCYFFAYIMNGSHCESIEEFLKRDQIIVLDDPISSFDGNNKYGMTVLLVYLFRIILSYESKAKLIIMTHDSSFAINLSKAVKSIDAELLAEWELQYNDNHPLKVENFDDFDMYRSVLKDIYNFVTRGESGAKVPVPNDIRRVWEAFLCFELGETSIANMNILRTMKECCNLNSDKEKFLDAFIPQVFLNIDSHSKDQIRNGNYFLAPALEGGQYEYFVKQITCFIHMVSPYHIAWRIGGKNDEKKERQQKLDELLKNMLEQYK